MKRFTGLLIVALWLAAVSWYWWEFVSLAPAVTVRTESSASLGMTSANELVLARTRYADSSRTRVETCGPIEFWTFPDCRKTRELLDADDVIISSPLLRRNGDMLIRRKGRLVVVNADTGQMVVDLPDVPEAVTFARVPGKPEVLIGDRTDVLLFEFGQEAPRWTAPLFWLRGQPARGIVSVSKRPAKNPSWIPANATLLNLETGGPDLRFDHLGKVVEIRLSPDGRSAIVRTGPVKTTPGKAVVCDAQTSEVLWTMPPNMTHGVAFHADGHEVHAVLISPERRLGIHRWRTRDGEPLGELKPEESSPLKHDSHDGRYGFWRSGGRLSDSVVKRSVDHINNFFGSRRIRFYLDLGEPRAHVRDLKTRQILGPLPETSHNSFLKNGPGMISFAYPYLRYYSLPPHRNYWWLAGWALTPPALVIAFIRFLRLISRRRSRATLPAPAVNGP